MDKLVGEGQVTDGIVILMTVEVVTVATEGFTESVRVIEHGSDTVEAETIEMELL